MTVIAADDCFLSAQDPPEWDTLAMVFPSDPETVSDFMCMFAIESPGGPTLISYKHQRTRRYIHIDEKTGETYQYQDRQYIPVSHQDARSHVLS